MSYNNQYGSNASRGSATATNALPNPHLRSKITHLITSTLDAKNPTIQLSQLSEILLYHADKATVRQFYHPHLMNMAKDRSKRMWLCGLMETLCDKYMELSPHSLDSIQYMIDQNPNPKLFKRIVITLKTIFVRALHLLVDREALESIEMASQKKMMNMWTTLQSVADKVINLGLSHNSEPIRLHTIRLVEILILAHSSAPQERLFFVTPQKQLRWCSKGDDFRLDRIPNGHPVLKPDELSKKGSAYLGLLLDVLTRIDTTHSSVTVILQSLLNISKQRTEFWSRIFGLLSTFLDAMPESLSESQRQSVKFQLKAMFLFLLRVPQTKQHRENFERSLQQLHCRSDLIHQNIKLAETFKDSDTSQIGVPQRSSRKRRADEAFMSETIGKVRKIQEEGGPRAQAATAAASMVMPSQATPSPATSTMQPLISSAAQNITTIATPIGQFQPLELADVIINNFVSVNLPQASVPQGQIDYSLLSDTVMRSISMTELPVQDIQLLQRYLNPVLVLKKQETSTGPQTSAAEKAEAEEAALERKERAKTPVSQLVKDFQAKVSILSDEEKNDLADMTWNQVLDAEMDAIREGDEAQALRTRILIDMVSGSLSSQAWREQLLSHLKEKLASRYHIAMQWLYHEYIKCLESNGGATRPIKEDSEDKMATLLDENSSYMELFESLLEHVVEVTEHVVESSDPSYGLYQEFVVEAPKITQKCVSYAHKYVLSSSKEVAKIKLGLATLRDLVLYRESVRDDCLSALLEYSVCDHHEARENCVILLRNQLYIHGDLSPLIEEFALEKLNLLTEDVPPAPKKMTFAGEQELLEAEKSKMEPDDHDVGVEDPELAMYAPDDEMEKMQDEPSTAADEQTSENEEEEEVPKEWTQSTVRQYSLLYVALCTHKHNLISQLVNIYVQTPGSSEEEEPKKTLLSEMDQLVRKIGIESSELLHFLRTYHEEPVDSEDQLKLKEKLARRFVMTLIEACGDNLPSDELIQTIKSMFFARDEQHRNARFLIPIITTLSSEEIVAALPWILRLPKDTARSVLSHTWNFQSTSPDPISPLTLLIELHRVQPSEELSLAGIVDGILHCLEQRHIFNTEVVGAALSTLIEDEKTPQALMRTIIQCLLTNVQRQYILGTALKTLVRKRTIWKDQILWMGLQRVFQMSLGTQIFELFFYLPKEQMMEILRLPTQNGRLILDHLENYLKRQEHRVDSLIRKAREAVHEVREEVTAAQKQEEEKQQTASAEEDQMQDEEGDTADDPQE